MAQRRELLHPEHATNEGSRLLRELLRQHTFAWVARRLRCVESTVRLWARERGKPSIVLRVRVAVTLGIRETAWDEPPSTDDYATGDPATTRR